ncbi:MAG: Clp1/GlmU family protein, partial [Candidatus Korarchaeota archaeon]
IMRISIKKGNSLRITGPASGKLISGKIKILGTYFDIFTVPPFKGIGVYAEDDSQIELTDSEFVIKEGDTIPKEWYSFAEQLRDDKVIMVIGAPDTGKSYFTAFLANMCLHKFAKVAIVNSDVGQSDIGPPTIIGLTVMDKPIQNLSQLSIYDAYFVGSITPTAHLLPMVIGTKKMVEKGLELAQIVIVNTTGMVYGGAARALKKYKIEAVQPDILVAIMRGKELSHILSTIRKPKPVILPSPVEAIMSRNREDRIMIRSLLYKKHFENARILTLDFREIPIFGGFFRTGKKLEHDELEKISKKIETKVIYGEKAPDSLWLITEEYVPPKVVAQQLECQEQVILHTPLSIQGLLLGIYANDRFQGLGILKNIDFVSGKIEILTPAKICEYIVLGHTILGQEYKEIAVLNPGQI